MGNRRQLHDGYWRCVPHIMLEICECRKSMKAVANSITVLNIAALCVQGKTNDSTCVRSGQISDKVD